MKIKITQKTIFLVISLIAIFLVCLFVYVNKASLARNAFVARLVPMYRSFLKLPDLLFSFDVAFYNTELPQMELWISPQNIQTLNQALPASPFGEDALQDENKVWVSAYFRSGKYTEKVNVRYRGTIANHWNSYKKSFLIKFPKDKLFNGMREMNLIIPDDRKYFIEELNNYRAEKLGLITNKSNLVRLSFNGSDHGVYLSSEHWDQYWVEKRPISSASVLYGIGQEYDWRGQKDVPSIFEPQNAKYWKSWNQSVIDLTPIQTLNEIVTKADQKTFEKLIPHIVDVDKFIALNVFSLLTGDFHVADDSVSGNNNIILIFELSKGKFEPIPYNAGMVESSVSYINEPTSIEKRILANPIWKAKRDKLLNDYIKENKTKELAFADQWIKKYEKEFLSDESKNGNNLMYLNEIKTLKNDVAYYFENAPKHLNDKYSEPKKELGDLSFSGSFGRFLDIIKDPQIFTYENKDFSYQNGNIVLHRGNYYFSNTLIVPSNSRLIIESGTSIYLGPETSIISYSPVTIGELNGDQVKIMPISQGKSWGNFAVVGAHREESRIYNLYISGGKESTFNGIFISATIAFHDSDVQFINSTIENAYGDDSINVKVGKGIILGNTFKNNFSDAIDFDFPDDNSIVKKNTFINNGGDSVDISWSNVLVDQNIIIGSKDKGISVGESSKPIITNNIIAKNVIGIAVKDRSIAYMKNNRIINNETGIAEYEKKNWFGGGIGELIGGSLWGNKKDIETDKFSILKTNNVNKNKPNIDDIKPYLRFLID